MSGSQPILKGFAWSHQRIKVLISLICTKTQICGNGETFFILFFLNIPYFYEIWNTSLLFLLKFESKSKFVKILPCTSV